MEKFKSKEEAQKAFEKEGLEYPKYSSGAQKGKIKGTLDSLFALYLKGLDDKKSNAPKVEEVLAPEVSPQFSEETSEEEVEEVKEEKAEEKDPIAQKPKFHRGKPKKFNFMSFKN